MNEKPGLGRSNRVTLSPGAMPPGRSTRYDNALAETINGLYKAELIHKRAPTARLGTITPPPPAGAAGIDPLPAKGSVV